MLTFFYTLVLKRWDEGSIEEEQEEEKKMKGLTTTGHEMPIEPVSCVKK